MPIDVAFVQVPPGEEAGTFHFGLAAEYLVAATRSARVIIAEVNAGALHTPDAPDPAGERDHRTGHRVLPIPRGTDFTGHG
jgi:acyl-CoA hydrolase